MDIRIAAAEEYDEKCLHCHISRAIEHFLTNVEPISYMAIMSGLATMMGDLLTELDESERQRVIEHAIKVMVERIGLNEGRGG